MTLLAIDTSGPNCAVCLASVGAEGVAFLAQRAERIGRGHAERLLPMVEEALASAATGFEELGRVAVAVGPGSFTGVRVGVAAARGLALALGIEAAGIGSLEALAAEAAHATDAPLVAAVLAGPRGAVFAYIRDAGGATRLEPMPMAADELADRIAAGRQAVALIGSGARQIAEELERRCLDARLVGEPEAPDVRWIARLALAGDGMSPPRPLYLRPPDAKPQAGRAVTRA